MLRLFNYGRIKFFRMAKEMRKLQEFVRNRWIIKKINSLEAFSELSWY